MRPTKKCPWCAEEILADARKCKHCRESLEDEAIDHEPSSTSPAPSRSLEDVMDEIRRMTGDDPTERELKYGEMAAEVARLDEAERLASASRVDLDRLADLRAVTGMKDLHTEDLTDRLAHLVDPPAVNTTGAVRLPGESLAQARKRFKGSELRVPCPVCGGLTFSGGARSRVCDGCNTWYRI